MDILFDHLKQWPLPVLIFLVGLIWGVTNPLLSSTSKPSQKGPGDEQKNNTFLNKILAWLPFAIVFGINQLGSLLNIILLGIGDISTILPFTNTVGFVITVVVDMLFFSKKVPSFQYWCGLLCIIIGTAIAMVDKQQ